MTRVLVLCHRIPYPPDKGDKIRAWHLLSGLAERAEVHLGAFVDDPEDWAHADVLRGLCRSVFLRPLKPIRGRLRALAALASRGSLSVAYYADPRMQRWVNERLSEVDAVLVYSSVMAQYIPEPLPRRSEPRSRTAAGASPDALERSPAGQAPTAGRDHVGAAPPPRTEAGTARDSQGYSPAGQAPTAGRDHVGAAPPPRNAEATWGSIDSPRGRGSHTPPVAIADYVDVDSEKWRLYAEAGGVMAPVHRLEARRLAAFERGAAHRFERILFVSEDEADCFLRVAPEHAGRVEGLPNGVDTDYFAPESAPDSPYASGGAVTVFTGAMDYRPNVDAVVWYAREVLPRVRETHPGVCFAIVGQRPSAEVRALEAIPGVMVTGRVPDVRPYLAHAAVVVAPLRIARGVQNKVLEAMAMARPVVATPAAMEGLAVADDCVIAATDDAAVFAARVASLMQDAAAAAMGRRAREHVKANCSWKASQGRLATLLALPDPGQGAVSFGVAEGAGP